MRSHVKKKQYQQHVKDNAVNGMSNTENGDWKEGEYGPNKNSYDNSVYGARGYKNVPKKRKDS